jgi:hypothetical protein
MYDWSDSVQIFTDDEPRQAYSTSKGTFLPAARATRGPGYPARDARVEGVFVGVESARTPIRFRDRVIGLFRAPDNIRYLRSLFAERVPAGPLRTFALSTLHDALFEFSSDGDGRALEVLASDPVAVRGGRRPAVGAWDEVRRLNRVFYEDRLALLREQAHHIERRAPRDGLGEDDEPYHMRMFDADSLRPPGLEHLNSAGPLYALREDQPMGKEGFRGNPGDSIDDGVDVFLHGEDDAPWGRGDAHRTPEQAMAEYWGDGWTATETSLGKAEVAGKAYGSQYSWGNSWAENGGTRFQRYESSPFWQKGGREGYEHDIEETLGTAGREMDAHVRRWDMDKLRNPRGQEYRSYGARSGHIV